MDLRSRREQGSQRPLKAFFSVFLCLVVFTFHQTSANAYASILENTVPNNEDARNTPNSEIHRYLLNSELDDDYKRSSSFFPLRGKKPSHEFSEIPAPYPLVSEEQEEDKRSQFYPLRGKKIPTELKRASYFMPMRGRKADEDILDKRMSSFMPMRGRKDGAEEDSPEKRMSSFMPMRGKKKMDSFHLGKPGTYTNEIINPSSSDSNKRASAFLPVRGKKSGEDQDLKTGDSSNRKENGTGAENHYVHKRSVSFMPMRGRRILSEDMTPFGSGGIATSLLEKKQVAFMPMTGRTYILGKVNDSLLFDLEDANIDDKSATMSAFENRKLQTDPQSQGHAEEEADRRDEEEADKRASSFMPMRGRRTSFLETYDDSDYETASNEEKRRSAFMPMRGRRKFGEDPLLNSNDASSEYHHSYSDGQLKRASSFMPMRGRRFEDGRISDSRTLSMDSSQTKRLSFMPMRGRRVSNLEMDNSLEEAMDKKSSSFMPMRGRRVWSDNDTEEIDHFDTDSNKRASYFMPMRGRRGMSDGSNYFYKPYPYYVPSGIGSSLMTRHYGGGVYPISSLRSAAAKVRKFDWDSVKRAFHATRGKRYSSGIDEGLENQMENLQQELFPAAESSGEDHGLKSEPQKNCRCKRSILRSRISMKPQRQYIALKRPMSFFATRGKRLDDSTIDAVSKSH